MGKASQCCQWPADMERRRIADLLEYQRKNPDYVFTPEQLPGVSGIRSRAEGRDRRLPARPLSSAKSDRRKPGNNNENRWCLATTLELLKEMKAQVQATKLSFIGERDGWRAIAINLSNPCGLELRKLARSSMVRFDNLRRNFRTTLRDRIHPDIQDGLIEFFHICDQNKALRATLASTGSLSAMDMALGLNLASPNPPSTPELKMICRGQTSVGSGELLVDADRTLSAVELRVVPISPHLTADNVDISTTMLSLPATERGSRDQEDAGRSRDADSWAAPNRLRSRCLPKADAAPAVRRGVRRKL